MMCTFDREIGSIETEPASLFFFRLQMTHDIKIYVCTGLYIFYSLLLFLFSIKDKRGLS